MCSVGLLNIDITDADCTLSTDDFSVGTVSVPVNTDTDIHWNIGDLYDPHIRVHWRTDTFSDTETISHTDFTEMRVQWDTDTLMLAPLTVVYIGSNTTSFRWSTTMQRKFLIGWECISWLFHQMFLLFYGGLHSIMASVSEWSKNSWTIIKRCTSFSIITRGDRV
jgi:hypothetical protein